MFFAVASLSEFASNHHRLECLESIPHNSLLSLYESMTANWNSILDAAQKYVNGYLTYRSHSVQR